MRHRILAISPALIFLTGWQLLVADGSRVAFLLSKPSEIFVAGMGLIGEQSFWLDLYSSAWVLLVGFVVGSSLGYVAGVSFWRFRAVERVAEAYLIALGSVPLFAIAPLLIFVLGIGSGTRVFIVALSVFVPMALGSLAAAKATSREFGDLISAFGMVRAKAARLIIAPATFFASLSSLKPAANAALVALFLSEWISAERGLAKFVLASMSIYAVPRMWVGLLAFVLIGLVFRGVIEAAEKRLTPWR